MRARTSGPLATALMLFPILAIPLLAVFGIPQFVPVAASTSDGGAGPNAPPAHLSDRVGESASYPAPNRYQADDLFAPMDDADGQSRKAGQSRFDHSRPGTATSNAYGRPMHDSQQRSRRGAWVDPFRHGSDEPYDSRDAAGGPQTASSAVNRDMQSHVHQASMEIPPSASRRWRELSIDEPSTQQPRRPSVQANATSIPALGTHVNGSSEMGSQAAPGQASVESPRRFVPRASRPGNPAVQRPPRPSLTWKGAVARLRDLGVRQYSLQPGEREDSFHFSCFFTPADNPRIRHRFESEANEPLRAVADVLAQIDDWKQDR